jgi:hypothetical protein
LLVVVVLLVSLVEVVLSSVVVVVASGLEVVAGSSLVVLDGPSVSSSGWEGSDIGLPDRVVSLGRPSAEAAPREDLKASVEETVSSTTPRDVAGSRDNSSFSS